MAKNKSKLVMKKVGSDTCRVEFGEGGAYVEVMIGGDDIPYVSLRGSAPMYIMPLSSNMLICMLSKLDGTPVRRSDL